MAILTELSNVKNTIGKIIKKMKVENILKRLESAGFIVERYITSIVIRKQRFGYMLNLENDTLIDIESGLFAPQGSSRLKKLL